MLRRNGYALRPDLEHPDFQKLSNELERFQLDFMATTRSLWAERFHFSGDNLYAWSRQWEYPYHAANMPQPAQRILDAGSGITFYPFYLASLGHTVTCCDLLESLAPVFETARQATSLPVEFVHASMTAMPFVDESFDAVSCLSVLEHVPNGERGKVVREFARVLRPGGRLIITADVSLGRDHQILMEDFAVMLAELSRYFSYTYPPNFSRAPSLLTTDSVRRVEPWRLPWSARPNTLVNLLLRRAGQRSFHSLGVVGLTFTRL